MLLDEQAAELLKRCERLVGFELSQIRGNLCKPEGRASAVWELLVMEAASEFGQIEYEPDSGGSPDIRLSIQGCRKIWIEAAFLYPRFWKEERKSIVVVNWIFSEAKRRGIPPYKIYPSLDGVKKNGAGPVRKLPELNERKVFLNSKEVVKFFNDISERPDSHHRSYLTDYTISLTYSPDAKGPYLASGGLAQEVPTSIKEHAVYRVLKEKGKQHDVPRVICIGGDQSPALRTKSSYSVRLEDAINAIFSKNHSLSAVIIVSIENIPTAFGGIEKRARSETFINPYSSTPLIPEEVEALLKLNFNKWKYSFPLVKWKNDGGERFRSVTGTLTWRPGSMRVEVEIPANIVVDALAGKTTLAKAFNLDQKEQLFKVFDEGWVVESCSYQKGNIELAEAPKIVLELSPPFRVYENKTV